jgi:hypothetical protein
MSFRIGSWLPLAIVAAVMSGTCLLAAEPRVTNDRYRLELVASEPAIVTPVGVAFDRAGRLLVVESHTHARPEGYQGPPGDRIRMLADSDGDGRLDQWSTFAEGFRHAMNLLVRPDGGVYLVTRHNVVLLTDTDGDGQADHERELVRLETDDDYPHNGLGGIAQTSDGELLLSLGENHGFAYRLIGSDAMAITGTGGADGVFRATADGGNLQRLAVGVWNPFSLCVDPHGRVFVVDNDPDASPPCRLLHIVPGGDYGYLFQYGRAGTHPLQAWNGELPGTLPMICGTGEAPTAIVPHAGRLWVTSWGDHRIESYRLVPSGATFTAEREVVVQGGADFRPTGMAVAPDGSLYFGDWVKRDYPVHGRGRIWRLVLPAHEIGDRFPMVTPEQQRLASLTGDDVEIALGSGDPFVHAAGVWALGEKGVRTVFDEASQAVDADGATKTVLTPFSPSPHPRVRLGHLESLRWNRRADALELLTSALADPSADVRLYAVRWIADERLVALRDDVAALVDGPLPTPRYYLAVLAAIDWLDHEPKMRSSGISDGLLARELRNDRRSPEQHSLALSLLSPDDKFLTLDRLRAYLQTRHAPLRMEAIRSLAQQSNPQRFAVLAEMARDVDESEAMRAEAIAGLAAAAEAQRELLEQLAASDSPLLAREADRVLRLARLRPTPPERKPPADNLAEWVELLNNPDDLHSAADAESGRRLFFSSVGARCSICHQHSGRGGHVGTDLTHVGRTSTRERIIASILQPSQEIAPEYQPWQLTTDDGKTHVGLRLAEGGDDGSEEYLDDAGNRFVLTSESIESRAASTTSIMPDGLEATISLADFRDLLAFLVASDEQP